VADFETIRKSSAPEKVAEQILRKIGRGELGPGDRLPAQRELAVALGVGRSSVREAVNALTVMGYLDVRHGRGTFIREGHPATDRAALRFEAAFSAGSLLELMEVRETLECKSAELAAERADDEQVEHLKAVLKKMDGMSAAYEAFLENDLAFHNAVADATGNRVICEMMKLLIPRVAGHHARLRTGRLSSAYRAESVETARQVVSAIEAGSPVRAAAAMRRHLSLIRRELRDIVS
jgi:GntR family transcriptional repressor for pyruvate dehydrogenase complex